MTQTNPQTDPTPTRLCSGPCGRILPRTVDHFYRQTGGDGFTVRCRDCVKAVGRERRAARRERRKAAPPPKRCAGPCSRELPAEAEHFPLDALGRVKARCHDCALAAAMAPASAMAAPPPENAARAAHAASRAAAKAALDAPIAELAELAGDATPVSFSSCEGRRNFIRNYIATAPPGQAAEAADRARERIAAVRAEPLPPLPDIGALAAAFERRELGEVP